MKPGELLALAKNILYIALEVIYYVQKSLCLRKNFIQLSVFRFNCFVVVQYNLSNL